MNNAEDERSNRKLVGCVQVEVGVYRWRGLSEQVCTLDSNRRRELAQLLDVRQCGSFVDMSMGIPDLSDSQVSQDILPFISLTDAEFYKLIVRTRCGNEHE